VDWPRVSNDRGNRGPCLCSGAASSFGSRRGRILHAYAIGIQHPPGFQRASCPGASSLSAARTKNKCPGSTQSFSRTTVSFGFQKIGLDGSDLNQLDRFCCFRCSGFGASLLKPGGPVGPRRR